MIIDEMIDNTTVNGISLRELQKKTGNASKIHINNWQMSPKLQGSLKIHYALGNGNT